MSNILKNIKKSVHEARECALVGNYNESQIHYQESLNLIDKYTKTCKNEEMNAFKELILALQIELDEIKKIACLLKSLPMILPIQNIQPPGNDPDVWAPPPQKIPSAVQNRRVVATKVPQKYPVKIAAGKNPPNRPVTGKDKRNEKVEVGQKFCGDGYDQSLVDMLENEILTHDLNVHWDDISGLLDAKRLLREACVLPLHFPELFTGIKSPYKGVLMVGPPGTGKTLLAKAVATECKMTFFNISSSAISSKWHGESQKLVKLLFDMGRFYAPSIIFVDEIDAICSTRGGQGENAVARAVKSEFLVQIDGISSCASSEDPAKMVMLLSATNFPWDIDEAMRRRLEKRIYIPLPSLTDRSAILSLYLKGVNLAEDVDLDVAAELLDGYSGSDIRNVCRDAAMMGIRRRIADLTVDEIRLIPKEDMNVPMLMQDLRSAIKNVNKTVSSTDLVKYENWVQEYGAS